MISDFAGAVNAFNDTNGNLDYGNYNQYNQGNDYYCGSPQLQGVTPKFNLPF